MLCHVSDTLSYTYHIIIVLLSYYCHIISHPGLPPNQIDQGIQGTLGGKRKIFYKIKENHGCFRILVVSYQSSNFLYTQSYIYI